MPSVSAVTGGARPPRGASASRVGLTAMLVAALAGVGCGSLAASVELRPPASPLLDLPAPQSRPASPQTPPPTARVPAPNSARSAPHAPTRRTAALGVADTATDRRPAPPPSEPALRRVAAALDALRGEQSLEGIPINDLALVRAALGPIHGPAREARSQDELWHATAPIRRPPQAGDVVFFRAQGGAPGACPVQRSLRDGVVEALCVVRGAANLVRFDPARPALRRDRAGVINSFLRARRRSDPPGTRYLAGQLLREVRAPR